MIDKESIKSALRGRPGGITGCCYSLVRRWDIPEWEAWLWQMIGPRGSFNDAASFWIESLTLISDPFDSTCQRDEAIVSDNCDEISVDDFANRVRELHSYPGERSEPLQLIVPLESEMVAAYTMKDEWDEKILLGITKENFYLYVWETSA